MTETQNFTTLDEWLHHIETLHAKPIDMGLERMQMMVRKMGIRFSCPVITVGGTNGKGSTVGMLESIYRAAGYKTCAHTSPHLLRFNERARINGIEASDEDLMAAFAEVEKAREGTLSYFEYTALGILRLFQHSNPDVVILEIGLGGVSTPSTRSTATRPSFPRSGSTTRPSSETPARRSLRKRPASTARAARRSARTPTFRRRFRPTSRKSAQTGSTPAATSVRSFTRTGPSTGKARAFVWKNFLVPPFWASISTATPQACSRW